MNVERLGADVAERIADSDDLLDRNLDSIRPMSLVERRRDEGAAVGFVDPAEPPTFHASSPLLCVVPSRP